MRYFPTGAFTSFAEFKDHIQTNNHVWFVTNFVVNPTIVYPDNARLRKCYLYKEVKDAIFVRNAMGVIHCFDKYFFKPGPRYYCSLDGFHLFGNYWFACAYLFQPVNKRS
jgi:hypothetical protein